MMKIHNLKIQAQYALPKLNGDKMFEIRKNDRYYEVGDVVMRSEEHTSELQSRI